MQVCLHRWDFKNPLWELVYLEMNKTFTKYAGKVIKKKKKERKYIQYLISFIEINDSWGFIDLVECTFPLGA